MIDGKADWLLNLTQWSNHLTDIERKQSKRNDNKSKTVVKTKKVGRNDACPCGSGKKYKQCCLNK